MGMILTQAGQNAVNALLASNGTLTIAEMSFGGADRHPTGGEVALTNELIRKPVLNKTVEAEKTRFDARLEYDEGPFVIYELGLHDENGTLIFVGRVDGLTKLVNAGDAHSIDVSASVFTSNFQNVVVKVDSNFAFVPATRKVDAGTGLTGGGDLSADRTLEVDFASNAEALAGASAEKVISPATMNARIDALLSAQIAAKVNVADTDRVRITRYLDDADFAFNYPGGTSAETAQVTFSYDYPTKFPGKKTKLFVLWSTNIKITGNAADKPRGRVCLAKPDHTILSNQILLGEEFSTTAGSYTWHSVAAWAEVMKPAADNSLTIQQRSWMDYISGGGSADASLHTDLMELIILEVLDES